MADQIIKAIAKMEQGKCVLFFPEMSANLDTIVVWDGAHNEAGMDYYRRLRTCRDLETIEATLRAYKRLYCNPGQGGGKLRLVFRDSWAMQRQRWGI